MSEMSKDDIREGIARGFMQSMGGHEYIQRKNVSSEMRRGVMDAITAWLNENKEDVLKAIASASRPTT